MSTSKDYVEVIAYRAIPSPTGNGYSISAEYNGNIEITYYNGNGEPISRTYGSVSKKIYKKFKIQICHVKEIYQISKHVILDDAGVIMCSSYPIDTKKCSSIKHKLCLEFDDITNNKSSSAFNLEKAMKIKKFIDSLSNDIKIIYVCCDSGESRSAALSAAIMRYLKMSDKDIWMNPYYHPNPLVYKIQCKVFGLFAPKIYISKKVKINERALKKKIKNA